MKELIDKIQTDTYFFAGEIFSGVGKIQIKQNTEKAKKKNERVKIYLFGPFIIFVCA